MSEFNFQDTYVQLPQGLYQFTKPDPVPSPKLVVFNEGLATLMGVNFSKVSDQQKACMFSGSIWDDKDVISQAYAGHQFGHFTILGDGRAHLLGEHVAPGGTRMDVQFKGSGRTPYSRGGDGKATLSAMLREYIISEAMYHLGVPTSRSLAVVATGEFIHRQEPLPGAILTRVAASHIRVGTFEYAASQSEAMTEQLLNYTIRRHYPELMQSENQALELIKMLMNKQAKLVVEWMRVGFIHGVMNTDNMTLSGETIDYGPCAFMDTYHPGTVFSAIDQMGRYGNQPKIAYWNLARFAETLLPFLHEDKQKAVKIAEEVLSEFPEMYQHQWLAMMCSKLGILDQKPSDQALVNDLLHWMKVNQADYTKTFFDLTYQQFGKNVMYQGKEFQSWLSCWQERVDESSSVIMRQVNPVVIPRNHQVEKVLVAAGNDEYDLLHEFLNILADPYENCDNSVPYQATPSPDERVHQTFCGT